MRGRKPEPTALKMFKGNPGKRPINDREPKVRPSSGLKPPDSLDKDAKKEWRRVVATLEQSGIMTMLDRAVLAAYCAAWSSFVKSDKMVQQYGDVLISPKTGLPYQSPYINLRAMADKQMRAAAAELGLTPSSRSRLQTSGSGEQDDFDNFLERKKG